MAQVKLTKTELRVQQVRLDQLLKYLPTLQLKKALLQMEVFGAENEIHELTLHFQSIEERIQNFSALLSDKGASELFSAVVIEEVKKETENIAGVEIPNLKEVIFREPVYSLLDTPIWLEPATEAVRQLLHAREKIRVAEEKKMALEKELREVSIRVNLFEKILIPRARENMKKIKIFLGDVQLAAVCQAKVAKTKILRKKV